MNGTASSSCQQQQQQQHQQTNFNRQIQLDSERLISN